MTSYSLTRRVFGFRTATQHLAHGDGISVGGGISRFASWDRAYQGA